MIDELKKEFQDLKKDILSQANNISNLMMRTYSLYQKAAKLNDIEIVLFLADSIYEFIISNFKIPKFLPKFIIKFYIRSMFKKAYKEAIKKNLK